MQYPGYTRTTWVVVLAIMLGCMWVLARPDWAAYIGSLAIAFHIIELSR